MTAIFAGKSSAQGLLSDRRCAYAGMDQDEVIRRLKGLGKGAAPTPPNFSDQTIPMTPVARSGRMRIGMAPIAAVVGVLALGTAALAVPQGAPLRQVVAGLSTEIGTDQAEVDADSDSGEEGVSGRLGANPCEGTPPTGTPAAEAGPGDEGVEGGGTAQVDPEDRDAQLQAWKEWREANCGPEANRTADDDDDDEATESDDDEATESDDDEATESDDDEAGESEGHNHGQGGNSGTHPHDDDPCHGPPPHSNRPNNGQPDRDAEQRRAEQEAWKQWHHDNCPPGQTNDHPGHDDGHGRPEDAGKPDDGGRPDGAGKPEDKPGHGEDEDS
ncbi:MAG TPA: hypothetical protein VMY88_10405 [Acidimicrobiales bacterium]|nr:hypothetical protein [Acidimicrobiales bacterium]